MVNCFSDDGVAGEVFYDYEDFLKFASIDCSSVFFIFCITSVRKTVIENSYYPTGINSPVVDPPAQVVMFFFEKFINKTHGLNLLYY